MSAITHERLLELLHYDQESGLFTWKVGGAGRARAGGTAGCALHAHGRRSARRSIHINYKYYGANRLAWFYMTGEWPIFEIDHINGNSLDDSWTNLRQATRGQNEINKGPYRNNRLGLKGVRECKGRFLAAIHRDYQRKHLGSFDTAEQAAAAYAAAAKTLDGDFARVA
jgi:hypothetical protein